MQSLNDDERRDVLGEVLMDELKVIREYVQDIPLIKKDVKQLKLDVGQLKFDVGQLKDDMHFVKSALPEFSSDLDDHERRMKKLEQTAH